MAFASPLAPGQDLPPAPAPLVNAYHPSKPAWKSPHGPSGLAPPSAAGQEASTAHSSPSGPGATVSPHTGRGHGRVRGVCRTELSRRKWPAPTSAGHKAIWSLPTGPGGVLVQTILEQIPTRPETERDKCQHSGAGELGRGAGAVFTPSYVKIRAQREVTYYIRQGHGGQVEALRILHVTFRGLSTQSHE